MSNINNELLLENLIEQFMEEKIMEFQINKIYERNFGSGWKQPFKIVKFVRNSNNTRAYIEVYEKSHKRWKAKTAPYDLSKIIVNQ
jgi:hypothetical protein